MHAPTIAVTIQPLTEWYVWLPNGCLLGVITDDDGGGCRFRLTNNDPGESWWSRGFATYHDAARWVERNAGELSRYYTAIDSAYTRDVFKSFLDALT
jgi:hypothetical protein